jgi:hypothetical protein
LNSRRTGGLLCRSGNLPIESARAEIVNHSAVLALDTPPQFIRGEPF